ncbi:hypothetical protein UFOVP172_20 [uncultured Caudovirales phage]|uniref:Uncharacterized protein n=1 Tax=uncultured Caudovirales phage TaxID=2100421 RepID=A0A6J7WEI0_9CAUD|nr:hypothetical protein UFOVP172_20 [uncultured Caudovirales phage]
MRMIAKFPGTCAATGKPFSKGDLIDYDKAKKRAVLVAENKPIEIRFASGATFYRNARGRCEDAPCCGCCTI